MNSLLSLYYDEMVEPRLKRAGAENIKYNPSSSGIEFSISTNNLNVLGAIAYELEQIIENAPEILENYKKSKEKPIKIAKDGRCTCSCADPCPLGKVGSMTRCTVEELQQAGVQYKR